MAAAQPPSESLVITARANSVPRLLLEVVCKFGGVDCRFHNTSSHDLCKLEDGFLRFDGVPAIVDHLLSYYSKSFNPENDPDLYGLTYANMKLLLEFDRLATMQAARRREGPLRSLFSSLFRGAPEKQETSAQDRINHMNTIARLLMNSINLSDGATVRSTWHLPTVLVAAPLIVYWTDDSFVDAKAAISKHPEIFPLTKRASAAFLTNALDSVELTVCQPIDISYNPGYLRHLRHIPAIAFFTLLSHNLLIELRLPSPFQLLVPSMRRRQQLGTIFSMIRRQLEPFIQQISYFQRDL